MSKRKQGILILILVLLLFAIASIFYLMDREVKSNYIATTNETNNVDYVESFTLQEIRNNKAYFVEDLPSYIPGKTGKNSIDLDSYKTSELKEGHKFKLMRIYKESKDGSTVAEYKFVQDLDDEKRGN
ncbi:hypothetical protein [Staphylococcus phage vB_SsapH-Golestan101-M]|nr:hypothetical protein [Staphylococcus phage vB_SsapH-Golestan101-M]